ncbi:hypothetical protein ElyMa_000823800 [Elysia marginata]|uniref:Uncharacterized protein n=1 Tax=Elysia marginata TaxID=1093978 RepID=A0AAV4GZ02_9GAST|nr:hypothetical protein ElyMa_000823800 [Elysia marginata]
MSFQAPNATSSSKTNDKKVSSRKGVLDTRDLEEMITFPAPVDKHCCEDVTDQCQELFNSALSKHQHVLFISVPSDVVAAVFMVESCPSLSNNIDERPKDGQSYSVRSPSNIFRPYLEDFLLVRSLIKRSSNRLQQGYQVC